MKKMMRLFLLLVLVLNMALLSACDEAQNPQIHSCIVGIWEVADEEAFALAVLPPGSVSSEELAYLKGTPELAYKFDADGTLSVLAVKWESHHNLDSAYGVMAVDLAINGIAEGRFSVDGDIVTVFTILRSDITHLAMIAGEEMLNTTEASEFLPLFVPPFNAARFQCVGDELILDVINRPGVSFTLKKAE